MSCFIDGIRHLDDAGQRWAASGVQYLLAALHVHLNPDLQRELTVTLAE